MKLLIEELYPYLVDVTDLSLSGFWLNWPAQIQKKILLQ